MKAIFIFALLCLATSINAGGFITVNGVTYSEDQLNIKGKQVGRDILGALEDIFTNDELKSKNNDGNPSLALGGLGLAGQLLEDALKVNGKAVGKDILTILKDIFTNDELKSKSNNDRNPKVLLGGIGIADQIASNAFKVNGKAVGKDILTVLKDIFTDDELKSKDNDDNISTGGSKLGGVGIAGGIIEGMGGYDELKANLGRDIGEILADIFLHNDELKSKDKLNIDLQRKLSGVGIADQIASNALKVKAVGKDILTVLKDIFTDDELKSKDELKIDLQRKLSGVGIADRIASNALKVNGKAVGKDILTILKDIFTDDELVSASDDESGSINNDSANAVPNIGGVGIAGGIIEGMGNSGELKVNRRTFLGF